MLLRDLIRQRIRSAGPMRFAEYMELALYHPELGYYARSDQRSGRAGDFFTSVDVGPLYGELLSAQFAQMGEILRPGPAAKSGSIDLVEAAAGNGRLSRDILNAARHSFPAFYRALRLTLVERSETARATHDTTLRDHQSKREPSTATLPAPITGIVFANELLDALPVHPVVMGDPGLSEIYVDIVTPSDGRPVRFVERPGPPGDDVVQHIARFDIQIPPGARGEVCPAAVRWVESVGRNLERGFLVLVDYGHEAHELYSDTHAMGTLTTYTRHVGQTGPDRAGATLPWLDDPGANDITAHVDLSAIQATARDSGFETLAVIDQSYFLLGLGATRLTEPADPVAAIKHRLALKTLVVPGGLGSTHKVLIFSKGVDAPPLLASQFATRLT